VFRRSTFVCFIAICVFGNVNAEDTQSKLPFVKLSPQTGDCIVFLGDSITGQCLYTQYIENYFYTRYPSTRLTLHNAGCSGDTIANALVRFDRDVAAYRPKYVMVLLGMNDGAAKGFDERLFDTYRNDMKALVKKIRDIHATPILITPTMYDATSAKASPKPDSRGRGGYYNGVLALYGTWLRELAFEEGLGFVDLHGPLNHFVHQARKTNPKFTLIPDGIHPDANGQLIMAYTVISDLGLSKRVSTIDLSRSQSGEAITKVTGGKISEARYTELGVEFTFSADALPLAAPDEAKIGAAMIPLGHRLSYEAISIHGLAAGNYRITINDVDIGEFPSNLLESKLEIEINEKTPQYQQARHVAELNSKRNQQVVVPLRELWRSKKTLDRSYEEQKQAPDDEAIKKRIAAYEKKLTDFDKQIKELDAKSRAVEDEIYRSNRPTPLHFQVTQSDSASR
jgi:lysophospholipase L1-like esterase